MEERIKRLKVLLDNECESVYTIEEIKEDYTLMKLLLEEIKKISYLENNNTNLLLLNKDLEFRLNNSIIEISKVKTINNMIILNNKNNNKNIINTLLLEKKKESK